MITQQISEAFVKLTARGFDAVKAQFAQLSTLTARVKAQLESTAKSVNVVGSAARQQFSSASNAMLRFAAAASPGDAMRLEAAYGRLSVQIGSLFLPVIRAATNYVEKLTAKLRELTPEQREQIGQWAKFGVGVLAVVGAGSQLLSFLPGLIGGLGAVRTAVASLVKLVGLGAFAMTGWGAIILAVVGVLGGLAAVSVLAAGKGDKLVASFSKAWESIKSLAEGVWSAVKPIFAAVGTFLAGVGSRIADVIGKVAGMASKVWAEIAKIMAELAPVFEDLAAEVMSVVDDVLDAVQPLLEFFYDQLRDALKSLAPVIKSTLGYMVDMLRQTIHELRILAKLMQAIASNPLDALDLEGSYKAARMQVDADDARRKRERENEQNAPKSSGGPSPTGVQSVYKPELSSIGEVLRKAQTASLGESREMAMNRERLELQKQQVQATRETTAAVREKPTGLAG